ncbi:MAG TPA: SURF1 family cytochrome oxidase biogenesis protein, partial [Burkholderiaceae bacterium]|nr:SURF1 family cytochrome oxidase biogenesis protein [Burkholderiaceae bacterium]
TAAAQPPGPVRQNLERQQFETETGLSLRPVTIVEDATADNAGDGLARRWTAPAVDVDRHYGYAAQWFAMSAACLVIYAWLVFVRPRFQRSPT